MVPGNAVSRGLTSMERTKVLIRKKRKTAEGLVFILTVSCLYRSKYTVLIEVYCPDEVSSAERLLHLASPTVCFIGSVYNRSENYIWISIGQIFL